MEDAKLNFSADEYNAVANASFILTKLDAVNKIVDLMGTLSAAYTALLRSHKKLPDEVFTVHPKISKGEQYRLLPYVILDYPRIFHKENIFAIRSFFWWANYFSITLHVGGSYMEIINIAKLQMLDGDEWYWCISDDAWQHHYETGNYILLRDIKNNVAIQQRSFIKLSRKLPLQDWQNADKFFLESYQQLLKLIS